MTTDYTDVTDIRLKPDHPSCPDWFPVEGVAPSAPWFGSTKASARQGRYRIQDTGVDGAAPPIRRKARASKPGDPVIFLRETRVIRGENSF